MSIYLNKLASDCVQRDLWYLVNPRARSSTLAALRTLQPAPSGLLNTIDPWTQSLTYIKEPVVCELVVLYFVLVKFM